MAVDMFLKLKDDTLKGESQDHKHKDEIEVLSWSWGMSQSGTTHMGSGGGSGKVSVNDLSVTKYIDLSSAGLQLCCATGKHIAEGTLVVRKAGTTPLEYVIVTMKDIIVTSVNTGGSGGEDRLTENVSFNFAEVEFKYVSQKADGSGGPDKSYKYSMAQNKKL
jgi:type VI secretion system secreted protein Hcp